MSDFGGMGDMGGMMGMLGGLQQKMQQMQAQAAATQVEAEAGGGLVKVVATCDHQIVSITLSDDIMDDRELAEDLVRAATNEVIRKGKEELARQMSQFAASMGLPPGLIPGL